MIKRPQIWIKNPHALLILLLLAATMALELGLTLGAEVLAASPLPTPQAPCTASSTSNSYNCTRDEVLEKEWNKWEESQKVVIRKVPTTAYTSRVEETDATPCIAADGSDICKRYAKGEVIYATNDLPLGTHITVDGIPGIVADRMNRRFTGTGRVDRYMGYDLKAALAHGLRMATLEISK